MLTILHTNDLHNRMSEIMISRIRTERKRLGDSMILLDAGDAVGAGNITFKLRGEPILDRMASLGYDAMTVGNREFHFTDYGFRSKLSRAKFPVLCGNIRPTRPERTGSSPVQSALTLERAGLRIAVFGISIPMITERMLSRKISAYVFDDPIASAERIVTQLRADRPDLVIALSHIGVRMDRVLAAKVPGIDLIIGGHTHTELPEGEWVGETLVVQAGWWGNLLGKVVFDPSATATRRLTASVSAL